ncbi:MAG TPA: hypothetical protein PLS93_09175 [Accumulibacter sp.]|jgi:hypothetical protein|nr:hypothetical protein [Accumulibacter sp.]
MTERRTGLASITACRSATVAMKQMVVEKLRDDHLVDAVYIEPTLLRPSQEVNGVPKVSTLGIPGETALDQIPFEGFGARLRGLFNTARNNWKLACRIHRGLLE